MIPRADRIAQAVGGHWVTTEDWREGAQAALMSMVQEFRDASPDEVTYWEVNFWGAFKAACIGELRKFLKKGDAGSVSIEVMADAGEELEAKLLDPIDQVTRREVLSILTRDEAVAVELAWFQGMQVRGEEGTVMGVMGKSRRMVCNHLASAKRKILADPRCPFWTGKR